MSVLQTCSCGHVQSVSGSETSVRCTRCGRPILLSRSHADESVDDTPTPKSVCPAEETRYNIDEHAPSPNTRFQRATGDTGFTINAPAASGNSVGMETQILDKATASAADNDAFDVSSPASSMKTPPSVDLATRVFNPTDNDDDEFSLGESNVATVAAPLTPKGGSIGSDSSQMSTFTRRNIDGSRGSAIDLSQRVMAKIQRSSFAQGGQPATDKEKGAYGIHRVLRTYQKGGMGRILIAYDQFLKRDVALKVLHPEIAEDLSIVQRFIGEAEITAQLEHPGIVPIHTLGLESISGTPYYTMKLIKGHTLQDAIKAYHRNPTKQELMGLVRRLVSVCKTMSFAHSKGVIHRDLKPANIMLSEHGETLVMDWGLAKSFLQPGNDDELTRTSLTTSMHSDGEARPELTMVGAVVGTWAFMSPEQATPEMGFVGPQADVFSLGAVLYYMLTGQTAFNGRSTQDILRKVRASSPPKPSSVKSYVPPDLEAICIKAMQRDPNNRYQGAEALFDDLCRWLDGEPVKARKESIFQKIKWWIKKHRRISMSVPSILGLLIALILTGIMMDRVGRNKYQDDAEKTISAGMVDLLDHPLVSVEGLDGVTVQKEKSTVPQDRHDQMACRVSVPRSGTGRVDATAPTGINWDLTSRKAVTFSILEQPSNEKYPITEFCVRVGKGSGYFEYRPSSDWWKERIRDGWTTFSVPLNGSASWTKTAVNDPSMEKIRWIEFSFTADESTIFWIDNLLLTTR